MIYAYKDIMDRNRCPRSLVACAAEELAKAYKFSSQDAFSFVRNIDYHPINFEGLSAEYEIVSDRKIKQFDGMERHRFFITLNRFLLNRRHVMKVMLSLLAKMVVNFTSTEEVNETKLKEIRAQYVASNKAQEELETIGIKLHLKTNTEKLLGQIQQERTRAKLMNLFVNQSYLKYGETVEDVHLDYFPICAKTEESLNDTATSTCAGIVTEEICAEAAYDTVLEGDNTLASVVDNADEAINCNKNNKDKIRQYFQDDGVRFEAEAERASDTQDTNTERDNLHDSAEGVLTGNEIAKKYETDEDCQDDNKRERSEKTPDKDKSNETLEKYARQHENRVEGISGEGIINHEVENNVNENLMDNTHIVTATDIGIKRIGRLDDVSNVAFKDDISLQDEGECNDINTKKMLDTGSENGWTDDEENDEDNFVLYGMMNYRPI